MSVLLFFHVFL